MDWPNVDELQAMNDVDGLIEALGHWSEWIRKEAVEALEVIGDARAVGPLINALGDKDELVRRRAVSALGTFRDAQAVGPLINALGDKDESVRDAAAWALGKIGDARAVEPLTKALEDEGVRQAATAALRMLDEDEETLIRDTAAWALSVAPNSDVPASEVESLIKALGNESSSDRLLAAMKLGDIGGARVVESLIETLGDEDEGVRSTAVNSLNMIGVGVNGIIRAHRDGSRYQDGRVDPADVIEEIGDAAIMPLINALKRGESNIASLLERMSHPVVGVVFERLEMYDDANEWYSSHGMLGRAAAVRRKKADMAAPKTEIHGDYIDDRDTIIKDSVVSKSTIGPGGGGDNLLAKLQQLSDLKREGLLSDEQFEAAKNKLLG